MIIEVIENAQPVTIEIIDNSTQSILQPVINRNGDGGDCDCEIIDGGTL
jgi:hypothetical protein